MNNETGTAEQQPQRALYGKVIGIVNDRSQLKTLAESLTSIGADSVEILDGAIGIQRLESCKESVSQYFFGDKGDRNALDHLCDSAGSLVTRHGDIHDAWRIHSPVAVDRSRRGSDQNHTGTKTNLTKRRDAVPWLPEKAFVVLSDRPAAGAPTSIPVTQSHRTKEVISCVTNS
jgi:hypothetical protein